MPNYGRRGSHPPRRHFRTVREPFNSHRSSDDRLLSLALRAMEFIMTVTMKQHQVSQKIVVSIAILMVDFKVVS